MNWAGQIILASRMQSGSTAPSWLHVVSLSLGGAIIIFLILAAVFGLRRMRRDHLAVLGWATKHGLRFSAADGFDLAKQFGDFWKILAPQAAVGKATNVCWGKAGSGDAILFDMCAGGGPYGGQCACCSCELPKPVATMTIRHRGCLDTAARLFGYNEIQFESADFNRTWCVESDDHPGVFAAITPQVMEFIMGSGITCLMTSGNRTMAVMPGELSAERCEKLLVQVQGFARELSAGQFGEPGGPSSA
jgi:hypothetical protein